MCLIYQKCLKKINVIGPHSNQSELSFYFINCTGEMKAVLWLITMGDSPVYVCFNLLLNGWSGYVMWPWQPIRGLPGDWWCHNAPQAYKKAWAASGGNHFSLGFEKATLQWGSQRLSSLFFLSLSKDMGDHCQDQVRHDQISSLLPQTTTDAYFTPPPHPPFTALNLIITP